MKNLSSFLGGISGIFFLVSVYAKPAYNPFIKPNIPDIESAITVITPSPSSQENDSVYNKSISAIQVQPINLPSNPLSGEFSCGISFPIKVIVSPPALIKSWVDYKKCFNPISKVYEQYERRNRMAM